VGRARLERVVVRRSLLRALVPLVAVGALAACSSGGAAGDEAQFCGEVDANLRALTKPTLKTDADVTALVGLYRELGDVAPLAIEDHWNALTTLYETASTVDTSDRDSRQRVSEQAFRTEASAVEVKRWLRQHCRVNLPVTTIVDHDVSVPVTPTTTLPS